MCWFTTDDAVKVQELTSFTFPKEYITALGNLVNIESLRNDETIDTNIDGMETLIALTHQLDNMDLLSIIEYRLTEELTTELSVLLPFL